MRYKILIFGLLYIILSCSSLPNKVKSFDAVSILEDKISIRALVIDENYVWYAGNSNKYGKINLKTNEITRYTIKTDSTFEFRSIAQTKDYIFLLSISNPAVLYKISKQTNAQEIVYEEYDTKVFYDSMHFKDEKNGMAMGDPTEDCLSVLITNDGGNSWKKWSCANSPKIVDGEAAFAASNTNLIITNSKVFMISGGIKSRVFVSEDFGKSWQVYETPIIQGEAMTGIFSADFYDDSIGFITGGNYDKPNDNFRNKAITFDGGKTWKLVSNGEAFGYASCVQFVPKSKGKKLIIAGANGVFYSKDFGYSWQKINDNTDFFTLKFLNSKTVFLAGKNKVVRMELKY